MFLLFSDKNCLEILFNKIKTPIWMIENLIQKPVREKEMSKIRFIDSLILNAKR